MAAIETPRETIRIVDRASGLCRGLDEIERWAAFGDGERSRIMSAPPRRLAAMRARLTAAASP